MCSFLWFISIVRVVMRLVLVFSNLMNVIEMVENLVGLAAAAQLSATAAAVDPSFTAAGNSCPTSDQTYVVISGRKYLQLGIKFLSVVLTRNLFYMFSSLRVQEETIAVLHLNRVQSSLGICW